MKRRMRKFLPVFIMITFLAGGCVQNTAQQTAQAPAAATEKQEGNVYTGSIVGKSNKAKTISIEVGKGEKAKTIMVKFDDKTIGAEHAVKGHASIINYEMRDGQAYATVVKPKLAKLPEGVTELKVDELKDMVDDHADFILIDSRPGKRYASSFLPGALSIPVDEFKVKAVDMLPTDKNIPLVFYCGGPT